MVKIFNKELSEYLKPIWIWLLVVALIGQFQIFNIFVFKIQVLESLPLGFLRFSQLVWALIITGSIYYIMKKSDFSFLQAAFVGFLYFVVFGILKIITRIALGHDISYLFLGDAERLSPLLESLLLISLLTLGAISGALLEKKWNKRKLGLS